MHLAIRPFVITGVALASAGILVAVPATTPQLLAPPDVRIVADVETPTTNALLAANLSAQPSITAVPDLSAASIADSAEELLGAIAIITEATGVAIEEVVMALGNVPPIFLGALEDLASGESPVDVLRGVGVSATINVRNMLVFPLRTLQGLPAPFGGQDGVFNQLENVIIAVTNAIIGFLSPPIMMSVSQANLPLSAPDTADVTVAQEATTGIVEGGDLTVADGAGTERQAEPTGDALGDSGEAVTAPQDADPVTVTTDDAGEVDPSAAPEETPKDTEKANGATDLTDGNMTEPGTIGTNVGGQGSAEAADDTEAVDSPTGADGSDTESTGTGDDGASE